MDNGEKRESDDEKRFRETVDKMLKTPPKPHDDRKSSLKKSEQSKALPRRST